MTRRRSSARSSDARHAPDHINPPKNSSRPSSTRKNGTNCSEERPSDPRSSRSPGSKSCSAKTKASSEAPSLLAESPRRPPSHRTLPSGMVIVPGDEIGQRGAVAAGAGDARPRLDGRRSGIAGEDAGDQQPLGAVLEGERERDAVIGGLGSRADEGDGAARGQRDALAAGGDAECRRRRDVQRAAGDRVEQALQRQRPRGVEADDQLEVRAADRPDVAAVLVRDERVAPRRDDRRAIGGDAHVAAPSRHTKSKDG